MGNCGRGCLGYRKVELTAKRDRQETLHGDLEKKLAWVPEMGLTAKRDRQETLHGDLEKRLAWVTEMGLTAERDRQETLHSSFQNNLHQSTGRIRSSKLNSQKILLAPRLVNICT